MNTKNTKMEYITVKNRADVEFTFEIPFTEYKKPYGRSYEPNKAYRIFLSQFKAWERVTDTPLII